MNEEQQNMNIPENFKSTGLSNDDVLKNREQYGLNKLEENKKDTLAKRIGRQLIEPMVIMLFVSAIISLIIAILDVTIYKDMVSNEERIIGFVEPAVILLIIFINSTFGVIQEGKVSKEVDALSKLAAPNAKVIRNHETLIIPADQIVKGDLLFLEAGDTISADGILLEASNLECDEAILTGETILVKKGLVEEDQSKRIIEHKNRVFSGTNVINGSAKVLVDAIGSKTQIGQIATLIANEKDHLTPFQKQTHKLSKCIAIFAVIMAIINFFIYIAVVSKGFDIAHYWAESLKVSVALSIASIPECLLAVVTVILTISVRRMSKKNALVKKMTSVETLGSASIICSDKTGTLTQNKMTVTKIWDAKSNQLRNNKKDNQTILEYGTLCTNGTVSFDENNKRILVGDPTETAIVEALLDLNVSKKDLSQRYERVLELPFESVRKMMTVVVLDKINNNYIVITKGAPDQVFKICKANQPTIDNAIANNAEMGAQALRVLGVSYKIMDSFDKSNTELSYYESDQELIGLLGIIDPPRKEVKQSIKECFDAGIRPIMITGDHKNTAVAIAKELGIMNEGDEAISGTELSELTDEELRSNIEKYAVYARVSPQDKIRIVKAWQSKEKIVSMTGDGVNDAPSLKAADIGCAMGITGTDVSKQAADVILVDDNFSTIVEAVKEGRQLMNIVKSILVLLLTTSFSCLFTIFLGTIAFGKTILGSLEILWINVVAETIPGIMLSIYQSKENVMNIGPRHKNEFILRKEQLFKMIMLIVIITFLSIISFFIGSSVALQNSSITELKDLAFNWTAIWNFDVSKLGPIVPNIKEVFKNCLHAGSALTFLTISIALSFNSICLADRKRSLFRIGNDIKNYKLLILGFFLTYLLIAFVAYVPKVQDAFSMNPFDAGWANVLPYVFILVILAAHEIYKVIFNKIDSKRLKLQKVSL